MGVSTSNESLRRTVNLLRQEDLAGQVPGLSLAEVVIELSREAPEEHVRGVLERVLPHLEETRKKEAALVLRKYEFYEPATLTAFERIEFGCAIPAASTLREAISEANTFCERWYGLPAVLNSVLEGDATADKKEPAARKVSTCLLDQQREGETSHLISKSEFGLMYALGFINNNGRPGSGLAAGRMIQTSNRGYPVMVTPELQLQHGCYWHVAEVLPHAVKTVINCQRTGRSPKK